MMNKLVLIEWMDAFSSDHWQSMDTAFTEPMICQTLGFLIKKNKQYITVCHTINKEKQVCGVMNIARKSILKITSLTKCE